MKNLEKIPKLIFFAGIFILPFIFWPKAPIPYEVPRVQFFRLWVEILGLATIISIPSLKKKKHDYVIILLVLLYFLAVFLTSLYGVNFNKSFWGNPFREDGLITFFHLIALFFIVTFIWQKSWIMLLAKTVAFSSFFIGLWAIVAALFSWNSAIAVSFGNPNFLGGYLAVSLPFSYLYLERVQKKLFCLSFIPCQLAAILLTRSWSAIVVALVSLAGYFFIKIKGRRKKVFFSLVSIFFAGATLLVYFLKYQSVKRQYLGGYMPEGRGRIITKALLAFKQKPLFGWGLTNFDIAFEKIDWPMKWGHDLYVDKPHSVLLEVLVTTGIIGLIPYLLIIGRGVTNFLRHRNTASKYFLLVLLLYILHSQTNIISVSEEIFFWIILGVAADT